METVPECAVDELELRDGTAGDVRVDERKPLEGLRSDLVSGGPVCRSACKREHSNVQKDILRLKVTIYFKNG